MKKKVLLVGYFGHGNPGDERTLFILSHMLSLHGIDYEVFGVSGCRHPIYLAAVLKKRLTCISAVIFSGGNLLQNESSNLSLYYYIRIIRVAKALGVKVLFAASGIGELRGKRARELVRSVLPLVDFFGARTSHDRDTLHSLGYSGGVLMPDLCFLGERQNLPRRDEFLFLPNRYDERVFNRLKEISDSTGLSPLILPMFYKEDIRAAGRYAAALGARLTVPRDFAELMNTLGSARFTVTERLHGAIFSLISHIPSLVLQSEKISAFMSEINSRAALSNVPQPVYDFETVSIEKIKELGAHGSEFGKILNSLISDTVSGFDMLLCRIISHSN